MSKVLVDRELLDSAATWLEVHAPGGGCVEGSVAEDLRAILAQPAEAEGELPEPYGWIAVGELYMIRENAIRAAGKTSCIGVYTRPQLLAALSAVTAERDRLREALGDKALCAAYAERQKLRAEVEALRKDAERWRYVSLQGDDTHWLNLLRVDLEDFGGNINAAVDALIDGEAPAMAAKEAGPEHVCSGCGAKGWTGNCLECIPY